MAREVAVLRLDSLHSNASSIVRLPSYRELTQNVSGAEIVGLSLCFCFSVPMVNRKYVSSNVAFISMKAMLKKRMSSMAALVERLDSLTQVVESLIKEIGPKGHLRRAGRRPVRRSAVKTSPVLSAHPPALTEMVSTPSVVLISSAPVPEKTAVAVFHAPVETAPVVPCPPVTNFIIPPTTPPPPPTTPPPPYISPRTPPPPPTTPPPPLTAPPAPPATPPTNPRPTLSLSTLVPMDPLPPRPCLSGPLNFPARSNPMYRVCGVPMFYRLPSKNSGRPRAPRFDPADDYVPEVAAYEIDVIEIQRPCVLPPPGYKVRMMLVSFSYGRYLQCLYEPYFESDPELPTFGELSHAEILKGASFKPLWGVPLPRPVEGSSVVPKGSLFPLSFMPHLYSMLFREEFLKGAVACGLWDAENGWTGGDSLVGKDEGDGYLWRGSYDLENSRWGLFGRGLIDALNLDFSMYMTQCMFSEGGVLTQNLVEEEIPETPRFGWDRMSEDFNSEDGTIQDQDELLFTVNENQIPVKDKSSQVYDGSIENILL